MSLKVLRPSDHVCYILRSQVSNRTYIGYTVNFPQRLRKHNGEITGGAKKTQKWRPWTPVCVIKGFYDNSSALRFEFRLQHAGRKQKGRDAVEFTIQRLLDVINGGDGSVKNNNKMDWPILIIEWFIPGWHIDHPKVINMRHI